jgi:hypothetical protein
MRVRLSGKQRTRAQGVATRLVFWFTSLPLLNSRWSCLGVNEPESGLLDGSHDGARPNSRCGLAQMEGRRYTHPHMAQSQRPVLSMREWADDESVPGEYVDGHRKDRGNDGNTASARTSSSCSPSAASEQGKTASSCCSS